MRWMRAAALVAVYALAMQSAGLPMMLKADVPACCCPHRSPEDACSCPVCAHQRLLESSRPAIETCAAGGGAQALAAPEPAVLPPPIVRALSSGAPRAVPLVVLPPAEPAVDVPTPPPLARG